MSSSLVTFPKPLPLSTQPLLGIHCSLGLRLNLQGGKEEEKGGRKSREGGMCFLFIS